MPYIQNPSNKNNTMKPKEIQGQRVAVLQAEQTTVTFLTVFKTCLIVASSKCTQLDSPPSKIMMEL